MTLVAIVVLGFFLGMRHATDADHVVAVTAIVSRERSARAAATIGALWGLGHSATILLVGGAIILFGIVIPPRLGLSMEMSVAAMLVVLGVLNLTGAMRRIDEAAHGSQAATEQHPFPGNLDRGIRRLVRPIVVGVVHGLAGSAAIALLVLATIRDSAWALFYLVVFGAGTMVGMMLLTVAMALPLAAVTKRFGSAEVVMARVTGLASIAFGLFLAYQIGVVDGLFTGAPSWSPK